VSQVTLIWDLQAANQFDRYLKNFANCGMLPGVRLVMTQYPYLARIESKKYLNLSIDSLILKSRHHITAPPSKIQFYLSATI